MRALAIAIVVLMTGCATRYRGTTSDAAVLELGAPARESTLSDGRRVLTWDVTGAFWASCRRNLVVQAGHVVADSTDCDY